MKISSMLIVLLAAFQLSVGVPIQEAIQKNLVTSTFESHGIHRGKSVRLIVENISNQPLQINVENGTYLKHEEDKYQDHVVVENQLIVLKPKEKKEVQIVALCVEQTDACPKTGSVFTILPHQNKQLLELCKIIMATKEFEYTGQQAIWELLTNGDPNYIEGGDSANVAQLRNFVGKALNKKVAPFNPKDYDRPLGGTGYNLSLWVEGNYYIKGVEGGELVEYGIFDENNNAISEIKVDKPEPNFWKKHNIEFRFDVEDLDINTKYYLQIKVDGVIRKEWMYRYQG